MGSQNQQPDLDTTVPSDSLAAAGTGITGPGHGQNLIAWVLSVTKHCIVSGDGVCEMLIPCPSQGPGQKRTAQYLQLVG